MSFDEILVNHLGQFGQYQALQYMLIQLPSMFNAFHSLSWTFTAAKMKHRCLYRGENETSASYEAGDIWYQDISNVSAHITGGCTRIYNFTRGQLLSEGITLAEPCHDGYVWDYTDMTLSAVNRWNLVCDRDIIRAVIQSMYFVGQFIGSFLFGVLSDRLGRKPIFILALLLQALSGIGSALTPWWPLLAIFRIGVGMAHSGIAVIGAIIATELVGPTYRVLASVGFSLFFALGQIVLGALAYPLTDYRYLQLVISVPSLVLLSYWWLVPESARWLISRGRYGEAESILQTVARCNGKKPLPSDWYDHTPKVAVKAHMTYKNSILALFRTPNLRKRTVIAFTIWSVVTMCYFGLALNPGLMGGDNRLGYIYGGILEIPGLVLMLFCLNSAGRKIFISGGFFLASACLLLTLALPSSASSAFLILVVIGKSGLSIAFGATYTITPELYPTVIRNTAIGLCSMIARAGGVAASFMALYLADTQPVAVTLVFFSLSFVAGISALFLPETTGAPLCDSVEEAEAFGKDQPICMFGCRSQRLMVEKKHMHQKGDESREMMILKRNGVCVWNDSHFIE